MRAVHVAGTGARTAVGLGAASSAAAVRAAISGVRVHPFLIDQVGQRVAAAMDGKLDPLLTGPERLAALAIPALLEACAPLTSHAGEPRLRLAIYLALPEFRPGFAGADAAAVRSLLSRSEGLPIDISEVSVFDGGHAAGLAALAKAFQQIQRDELEACLVGGVDSYVEAATIEWLDANRQLSGGVARSAFVPGEGAGFCLLVTDRVRARFGLPSHACVAAVGVGHERHVIKTPETCLGEGLTAAVHEAVKNLNPREERINNVICDLNGERYRGEEWGFVCLRLPQYFEDPTAYRSPADCWGDVGAASGPLFVALACQAAARGYATGPLTLVWASSENGLRAAAMLETTTARA